VRYQRILLPFVATAMLAAIVGCNEKAPPQTAILGPALDPARAEILGIKLRTPSSQAMAAIEEAARKSDAGVTQQRLVDVSGQPYVWLFGYGFREFPLRSDSTVAILSPPSADNGVLAVSRKLDFENGLSKGKPKPSSTQLLNALIEKFGMPTLSSLGVLTREEFAQRVEAESSSSVFFWIAENASKIEPRCQYSTSAIDDFDKLNRQADLEEVFKDFYITSANNASLWNCGVVIRSVIRTSAIRDSAAELTISMVDLLAADDAYSKVKRLWKAKQDAEEERSRMERESRPKAPVPRL
jgi:hypothetical protein